MERIKGYVYLLCAFGLAGTSVVAASFVNGRLGTFTITSMGLLFSLACLLPFCMGKLLRTIRILSPRQWLLLFCQALFGVLLFRMFLLYGLIRTSPVEAGILTGATPAITVLLAVLVLREKMKAAHFLGVAGTICGILLIQGVFMPESRFTNEHMVGNLLVLGAAGCESLFNVLSRSAAVQSSGKQEGIHPVVQTTLVSAMAWLISLIPSLAEQPLGALSEMGWQEWLALVWYGPVVTALAFICWYAGIRRCRASTAAAFSGMMPFTSLALSVWLLQEQAGWAQWAGGLLVIAGMVLIGIDREPKLVRLIKSTAGLPKKSGT
ncbi:drug/metabolite transporter (DMT)-like permease [Paenibacillus rhizosphaerae]|uniref:Drug/metabolite transporter (DMT)-like permease n=1 Tax=Paenibacillus rhizosphaerae TaxID=297318 RepID=A0A839TIY9_9BACL|nr:DMT family transporter [Paenibacillus rhizosphaerae]MBB3126602.1 drug/metabolite transporter (DMT)-like permease [Paenibacillus rhizosphaerae]